MGVLIHRDAQLETAYGLDLLAVGKVADRLLGGSERLPTGDLVDVLTLGACHGHRVADRLAPLGHECVYLERPAEDDTDCSARADLTIDEQARLASACRTTRHATDEGQAAEGFVRPGDELVDGEGPGIGEEYADHVVRATHGHSEDRDRVRGGQDLEVEAADGDTRKHCRPHAHAARGLDAVTGRHDTVGSAPDRGVRTAELRGPHQCSLRGLRRSPGHEDADQVRSYAGQRGEGRREGLLSGNHQVVPERQSVADACLWAHTFMVAHVSRQRAIALDRTGGSAPAPGADCEQFERYRALRGLDVRSGGDRTPHS